MLSLFSQRTLRTYTLRHAITTTATRAMSVSELATEDSVHEFQKTNNKSVLYFTASWCGPCRQIKPIYEQMSNNYTQVAFGKVDVDQNPDAAAAHAIQAVPTFISFQADTMVDRFSGADPSQLEQMAQKLESR